TLTDQTGIEPLFGNALELAEQVQSGCFIGVAPFAVEQPLRKVKQQRGAPRVFQVFQAEVNVRTDNAGIPGDRGTDQVWRELQHGVAIKLGSQPFLRQFDAVALDAGEADFQAIAFGTHGFNLDGLTGRLWRRNHRSGGEVERYSQDIGVFDIEQALLIE